MRMLIQFYFFQYFGLKIVHFFGVLYIGVVYISTKEKKLDLKSYHLIGSTCVTTYRSYYCMMRLENIFLNHKIIQNRKLQSYPSSQTNHFCNASYRHNFRIDGEISFWNEFYLVAFISKK